MSRASEGSSLRERWTLKWWARVHGGCKIPLHALSPLNGLGGLAFLMLLIEAVTGIILGMYYEPRFNEANLAYESVVAITENLKYGWLLRGIHYHAANLMIVLSLLHFLKTYIAGNYREPKGLCHVVGILTGLLAILASITGYSMRADHIGAEAILIGQTLVKYMPMGGLLFRIVYGVGTLDDALARYNAYHYALGALLIGLVLLHVWFSHRHHVAPPMDDRPSIPVMPTFPNFLLSVLSGVFMVLGGLVLLSVAFPPHLGVKYVPGEPVPPGLPEWYMVGDYTLIKSGINPVIAGVVIPLLAVTPIALMPWIDSSGPRHPRYRRFAMIYLSVFMAEFALMTVWGYLTPGQQVLLSQQLPAALAVAVLAAIPAHYATRPKVVRFGVPEAKRVERRPILPWRRIASWVMARPVGVVTALLGCQVALALLGWYWNYLGLQRLYAVSLGASLFALGAMLLVAKSALFDLKLLGLEDACQS